MSKAYKDEELEPILEWGELEQTLQFELDLDEWVGFRRMNERRYSNGMKRMQDGKIGVCWGCVELPIWKEDKWW